VEAPDPGGDTLVDSDRLGSPIINGGSAARNEQILFIILNFVK
jgi:hypothetical protein